MFRFFNRRIERSFVNNVINDTAEKLVEEVEDENPLDNKEMQGESSFHRIGNIAGNIILIIMLIFLLYFFLIDPPDMITEFFLGMRVFICDMTSGAFCI